MNNRELSRQLQVLKDLMDKVDDASNEDIEMQSHWAKYLCVLSAGFLENSIAEVYSEFVSKRATADVAAFARRSLSRIHNPRTQTFIEVAASFNKTWGEQLGEFVEENGRKESINSIMGQRHLIAHGKPSDISFRRLCDYFDKSVEVVEFMEAQCL